MAQEFVVASLATLVVLFRRCLAKRMISSCVAAKRSRRRISSFSSMKQASSLSCECRDRPGADGHSGGPEIDCDGSTKKRMGTNWHLPIRARSATGWTVGAASYDSFFQTRSIPICAELSKARSSPSTLSSPVGVTRS